MSADTRFREAASALGYSFEGELKMGGNYVPLVRDGYVLYVSGQVPRVLRVTVFTQSAADFTQQSEVADAASELLHEVLGEAGKHTRTSVGVYQLPKNASVELDLIASSLQAS